MAKSGDSKLADAAAAQLKNFRDPAGSTSEQLPEMLQGGAEEKKAAGATAEEVKQYEVAIEKLTAVLESMSKRLSAVESRGRVMAPDTPLARIKCGTCSQPMSVCHGKHVSANVMPRNDEYAAFFQGVILNGVRYYGPSVVPLASLNDIAAIVSAFEQGEALRHHKRPKVRGRGTAGISLGQASSVGVLDLID